MSNQDPYNIVLSGWLGVPVPFNLKVYSVPPNPDGSGGTVADISGWTFLFTLKDIPDQPDSAARYLHDFVIGPSPAGVSGVTSWEVPDTIMSALTQLATYYWDTKVILPAATEPQMLMSGTIGVRRTITLRTAP